MWRTEDTLLKKEGLLWSYKNAFAAAIAYASVTQKDPDPQSYRENTHDTPGVQPRANSTWGWLAMRQASISDTINL